MEKVIESPLAIGIAVITIILTASMTRAEASLFGLGGEEDHNKCPIMSFTCDETPGVLEKIYLGDGISFQETNDLFPPIGILRGGHDMVKLGTLVDENGKEVYWSELTDSQKMEFEEEHGIIPPEENTNATELAGEDSLSANSSSIADSTTSSNFTTELTPNRALQQPRAQDQVTSKDTQAQITTNNSDTSALEEPQQSQQKPFPSLGASQTNNATKISLNNNLLTYQNPLVSIQYPSDWQLVEKSSDKLTFIKEKGFVTVDVNVDDLEPSDTTLSEYANKRVNELREQRTDFQLIEFEPDTISGDKLAQEVVYSFARDDDDNVNKVMRIWSVNNGKLYTIAYIAESGKYDQYLPIAHQMIDSFEIGDSSDNNAKQIGSNDRSQSPPELNPQKSFGNNEDESQATGTEDGATTVTIDPSSSDSLSLLSHRISTDEILDDPTLDIDGEIQNNGTESLDFVRVTATFYDATNSILGSDFTYTEPTTLEPGQTAPFKLSAGFGDNLPVDEIASIKLNIRGR